MKKIIILTPLVLFLFACEKSAVETNNMSQPGAVATPKNSFVDSMDLWTRNIQENYRDKTERINITDKNNKRQGKWVVIEFGKGMQTVFYKDGKRVEGC